ncbi:MAG: hypothetical protein FWE06_06900 [Oscillospiraceae bacterium]|nr:hypothetical protein [Oscillospiraceae bacterium]
MIGNVFFRGITDIRLPWGKCSTRATTADQNLREIVRRLLNEGANYFYTNLQTPSDVTFAQMILHCKSLFPQIQLEIALPNECGQHKDLLHSADTVTISEENDNDFSLSQIDMRLLEIADMAIVMPLENMPRDPSTVLLSRMTRQKGVEIIFYSDTGIHRAKAQRLPKNM